MYLVLPISLDSKSNEKNRVKKELVSHIIQLIKELTVDNYYEIIGDLLLDDSVLQTVTDAYEESVIDFIVSYELALGTNPSADTEIWQLRRDHYVKLFEQAHSKLQEANESRQQELDIYQIALVDLELRDDYWSALRYLNNGLQIRTQRNILKQEIDTILAAIDDMEQLADANEQGITNSVYTNAREDWIMWTTVYKNNVAFRYEELTESIEKISFANIDEIKLVDTLLVEQSYYIVQEMNNNQLKALQANSKEASKQATKYRKLAAATMRNNSTLAATGRNDEAIKKAICSNLVLIKHYEEMANRKDKEDQSYLKQLDNLIQQIRDLAENFKQYKEYH